MTILLPAIASSFAALCLWLVLRVVNRRERWAKWTLAASLVAGMPVVYVLSFGPGCQLAERGGVSVELAARFYRPLIAATGPGHPSRTRKSVLLEYVWLFAKPPGRNVAGPPGDILGKLYLAAFPLTYDELDRETAK